MLDFKKSDGLVPAIVQDDETGEVLMLAYMNEEAWKKTLASGKAHYWSRSRQKLWLKGGTSGHIQEIQAIYVDCDLDTVVLKVGSPGWRSRLPRRISELLLSQGGGRGTEDDINPGF
jgi:phosphoribosyl-AMP cyclohydrolase